MNILELKKLRQKCTMAADLMKTMAVFDARKLKLNNYYEVILSDKSTQICKFIQIIDDLSNQYICLEIGLNHRHNKGIYY